MMISWLKDEYISDQENRILKEDFKKRDEAAATA